MATIGARLAERDRRRFVGRSSELAFLERCLGGDGDASVVLIHGPGGIGKSTLLRELARRAGADGRRAHFVEGRELAPAPRALDAALAAAREETAPLVLIDTYERMTALDGYLRGTVVPSLPERALVVIAGRERPSRGWLEGGWESLAVQLELSGLSADEAQELLALHGVDDAGRIDELVGWAKGSPLALALAGDDALGAVPGDGDAAGRAEEIDRPELMRALIRRLAEAEIDGPHLGPLAVAAIARVTTIDMLREVLPDSDAVQAYMWLRERTFAGPLGDGIALHELVRKALHGDLRHRDRERERDLRRRIADHLHAKAVAGHQLLSIDLSHLVENEAIRWGFSWDAAGEHRLDEVRPGDAEAVLRLLRERRAPERWSVLEPYFERAPERIAIVRDLGDRIRGFELSVTSANAPPMVAGDPQLGPWLEHARATGGEGRAVLWQSAVDFTADPRTGVQAMLGMSGILRSGLENPRYAYLPIDPRLDGAVRFAQAAGGRHVPELDVTLDGRLTQCYLLDYGPGGLLGAQRALIYAELGLVPPQAPAEEEAVRAVAGDREGDLDLAEAVRDALRNLGVPHKLADSPLASGATQEQRAASVRTLLEQAAARAFGETANEQLLRRVLERGYLDPAPSHEQAADELALSRAAYFRRLRAAAERVAALLAADERLRAGG
ncbi:ATP-binding protein [Conexibacter sp. JD483]|uniref:AAA family ATPase n=1 Tax=unclassified Conexibacter TaxID=2627773 RepID=UPI0027220981|nr:MULTISPECIES: ATP-binding protein [unclassified Conexibacter]MDO8184844.1 ATP-binding protein [Conexibacter sp. CPCC 205706]MDO8196619.1 ATP-binding protein [Conexibacter sp. CPCC 205762]MDR9368668.1 ATP-binding protein [Conexibacter sp. JD483]